MSIAAILLFLIVAFLSSQAAQRWGPLATNS